MDPTDEPTEDPSEDPSGEASVTVEAASPNTGSTLTTADGEELETENGKFVEIAVTVENEGGETIGLDLDSFRLFDADGKGYELRYATFTTSGPELPAGKSATATLYADVPVEIEIAAVGYSDSVATGGHEVKVPVG